MIAPKAALIAEGCLHKQTEQQAPQWLWQKGLLGPLGDFLQRGGKRIRADLVTLSFKMAGGTDAVPRELIDFIELMHAGSLIVDDIEDGSELRRGRPCLHRTVGVPVALNTGNWMYFSALEKLTSLPLGIEIVGQLTSSAISTIRRCHEGQAIDLAARVDDLKQAEVMPTVKTITRLKTGGLTALATKLGAISAQKNSNLDVFETFGMQLGIGLQMQNDFVELQRCAETGEPSDDLRNARATWAWAWASQQTNSRSFHDLQQMFSDDSVSDQKLAQHLIHRISENGSEAIRNQLRQAIATLDRLPAENSASAAEINKVIQSIVSHLEPSHV
jgi:geranylgeranyl pyrophosphate synthase